MSNQTMKIGIPYTITLNFMQPNLSLDFIVIPTNRRSFSIQLKADGKLFLRCPLKATPNQCHSLLKEKSGWILNRYLKLCEHGFTSPTEYTPKQKEMLAHLDCSLRKQARSLFQTRLDFYAPQLGVTYHKLSIRNQKTRWGSCSSTGHISLNYRLLLAPIEVIDYVVVHELCHLVHLNHSPDFWNLVESILPNYKNLRAYLKHHSNELTLEYHLFQQQSNQS